MKISTVPNKPVPYFWPKVILMSIGCAIVFAGLYAIVLVPSVIEVLQGLNEESDDLAYRYFDAIRDNDMDTAYALMSPRFQSVATQADLQQFVDENPIFTTWTAMNLSEPDFDSGTMWMEGTIGDEDESYTLYVEATSDPDSAPCDGSDCDSAWLIDYFVYDYEVESEDDVTDESAAYSE